MLTDTALMKKIYPMFQFKPILRTMHINQRFGQNLNSYYKEMDMIGHDALDFKAKTLTTAYAPIDGTVSIVVENKKDNTREGEYICLDSPRFIIDEVDYFIRILYYHLDSSMVPAFTKVKAGQPVCKTDNTGAYTTGPHLHFGVTVFKNVQGAFIKQFIDNGYRGAVDPLPFFKDYAYKINNL